MELADKDFNYDYYIKVNEGKDEQNVWKMELANIEFICRLKSITRNMHILELKNIITEIKNVWEELDRRLDKKIEIKN